MASIPPPSEPARGKRPRWLVMALIGALVIGAGCWTEGCAKLSFYRGETERFNVRETQQIKDDASRARVEAKYRRFVEVADDTRKRAVPFAAGIFVLGAALLALSARGLMGRPSARSALVQVLAAQAIAVGAEHWVLRDMLRAETDWQVEQLLARQKEERPPDQYASSVQAADIYRRYWPPAWLAFRTLASGLIVFALTRQRSREFFQAAEDAVSER